VRYFECDAYQLFDRLLDEDFKCTQLYCSTAYPKGLPVFGLKICALGLVLRVSEVGTEGK
jgi:hypothetical protein